MADEKKGAELYTGGLVDIIPGGVFARKPKSTGGAQGPKGDPGAPGQSIVGPVGPKGEPGTPGISGKDGKDGLSIVGPPGRDGEDGADGVGIPGSPGATGATGATGPAGAGAAVPWRCREYQAAIGANVIVDGTYFFTPGVTNPGGNRPVGAIQRQRPRPSYDSNGSFEFGHHSWVQVIWARISMVVTGSPSFDWIVPNVDNNFGVYREALGNGVGTSKMNGTGTGTAFSTGTGNDKANVGDMLMSQGSDNVGEPLYISAVVSDTSLTIPNSAASGSGTVVFRNYKFLRKVYQLSNGVAQTPVNATGTESLTAGTWIYHIFANNDSLQVAFNWIITAGSVVGIVLTDLGAELWNVG